MAGNTFGQAFRVTTFGESHGPALGAIVDGCPPGLMLTAGDLQLDLDRRRPGQSRYTTQRREADEVKILSGVFEDRTTGTSIGLAIENTDQKSKDYSNIAEIYRPAHADFSYQKKYGHRDYRGGGRASARETAMRVAAGGIAKKYLREAYGLEVRGYLSAVGNLALPLEDWSAVPENDFFCAAPGRIETIAALIDEVRKEGDSIGAEVRVVASNVPVGLGEPVFGKLDADIASAMMGINAVKAVGIGDGQQVVAQRGTQHRDEMDANGFLTNHAGGVLGGISSGQDVEVSIALKPTSSLITPGRSQNMAGEEVSVVTKGRHDPCVGIRAVPIAEAMLALVLMDHVIRQRGQNPNWLAED